VYIFNIKRFEPIIRPTVLTAFMGYLLVIVALAGGLVTRYTRISTAGSVAAVKSVSATVRGQRLHKDATDWAAPLQEFTVFVCSVCSLPQVPAQLLLVPHLDESLYNRPPPTC
jgi:hypothetical protein